MMAGMSEPWWTYLAAAAREGAREVVTDYPVPPVSALAFGAGGNPARGQWVLTVEPGRRFAGDDLLARAAAPRHRNYPAGALISHLNDLEVSRGSGSLVLV
jgi:hypothetical protein